ncbi:hypothetical protein [Spongorhabdus nitratireducens]
MDIPVRRYLSPLPCSGASLTGASGCGNRGDQSENTSFESMQSSVAVLLSASISSPSWRWCHWR